jgi:hypothetical protein
MIAMPKPISYKLGKGKWPGLRRAAPLPTFQVHFGEIDDRTLPIKHSKYHELLDTIVTSILMVICAADS